MHAESDGHGAAGSYGPHISIANTHDQKHHGVHVELSVFETATSWTKVDIPNVVSTLTTPVVARVPDSLRPATHSLQIPRHSYRWRPPLRAPPIRA